MRTVAALDDVARFLPEDPVALVTASFCCPLCLGSDAVAELVVEHEDPRACCRCERCDADWTVAMTSAQLLRLILHPPWHLRVVSPD